MESHFDRQRRAIHLVGDGIALIIEGLHILSARRGNGGNGDEQSKSDSELREGLRQLVLSQVMIQPSATSELEATGSGPNLHESNRLPNHPAYSPTLWVPPTSATPPHPQPVIVAYAPPPPLQAPVAEGLAGFVPNYKPGPRPYLRPNLTEPVVGPQQEPPAMTPPQREITSSPTQREITSSPFEGIRIRLRHQLSQRDRGESN